MNEMHLRDDLGERELMLRGAIARLLWKHLQELRSRWRKEINWRIWGDDRKDHIGNAIDFILPHMVEWLGDPQKRHSANSLRRVLERYVAAGVTVGTSMDIMFALRCALLKTIERHFDELNFDGEYEEVMHIIDSSIERAVRFIAAYYEDVFSKRLSDAEVRFSALFEHAGDAILVADANDGRILMTNMAAEEMFDCNREAIVGRRIVEFVAENEVEKLQTAIARSSKEGSAMLPGIMLRKDDGTFVPTCIRITYTPIYETPQLIFILHDITELYALQKELEDAKRMLEEQVKERTRQLEELYERERKRVAQLRVLAKVAQEALKAFDMMSLYSSTVMALREHFRYYDVALFEVDEGGEELILRAHSGAYEGELPKDYRQRIGVGIVGLVAEAGEPICVGNVLSDPRYVKASEAESATRSELAVPIKIAGNVIGVIDVQAPVENAFGEDDLGVLQAIADQVANAVQAIRQYQRAHMFREFNERIIENFPESIAVLNSNGIIVAANPKFCQEVGTSREEVIGKHLYDVVDQSLVEGLNLRSAIAKVLETGEPRHYLGVQHFSPRHLPKLLEIHIMRLQAGDATRVLFLADDATERSRRAYKLEMLLQITQAMEETLELNRLLHAILKSLTAGPGLGFNRAILFLVNEDATEMETAMAVGPATIEEAHAIWAKLAQKGWTLRQFIDDYPGEEGIWQSPFPQAVREIRISLSDRDDILVQCLMSKEVLKIERPSENPNFHPRLKEVLGETEIVCMPLVAKNKPLGVIIADNAFSGHSITSEEIEVLQLFATQAALAIDNAWAYQKVQMQALELSRALDDLRDAQEKLVRSERLAAIGEVAARVAHEIRNPLVTIGGYARAILKSPGDVDKVVRNANIIYEEVRKFEKLLREMLEFASPKQPQLKPVNINDLVRHVCTKHEFELAQANVFIALELAEDIPVAMLDSNQIERVLINLIQNGVQAMGGDGLLTIRTWSQGDAIKIAISDTGQGIPPDLIQHIFEPFFTTKPHGTGLGLAIVKRIIEDHGGVIEVQSQVGYGTTFLISLPIGMGKALQAQ